MNENKKKTKNYPTIDAHVTTQIQPQNVKK